MITGSFAFNGKTPAVIDSIRKVTEFDGMTFHRAVCRGFSGGFFLHSLLPYKPADLYYFSEKDDILVLLSGAVFNRLELFSMYSISGAVPDPELIATLFLREGPGFVRGLNGDFAIFIFKPSGSEAYLFRDHVGIRPLAWTADRATFTFSSDIIGLCRAFSEGRDIDTDYLTGYFRYIDFRKTPDQRVGKLLPGHYLRFSEKGITVTKYWEPEKIRTDKTLSHDQVLDDLKNILIDAVRIRCDNRFYAGAHVSSGLDSGVVSTLARKSYPRQSDFPGFSWSPGNFTAGNVKYDERELVIKSCENAGIRPVFSDIGVSDFSAIVSGFYSNHGSFAEERTVDQAVAAGVNLIFSGWGGDEFISTGDRGIETDLLRGMNFRAFFRRNNIHRPKRFIKDLRSYVVYPALGIMDQRTAESFRDDARYLKRPFMKSDRRALRNFYFHTSRRQLHLRLLQFYHLQERCESWAVNGFHKGVEYRYPLLDRRIIEYMVKVPSVLLCKTGQFRPILRGISEGILPEEVRGQMFKTDPVYRNYMTGLYKDSALIFMDESKGWKENPDLNFIDFDLLNEDIRKFREEPGEVNARVLFRALVYIKAIHEFTVTYRRKEA